MRYFRSLPPIVRAAGILGALFPLAGMLVLTVTYKLGSLSSSQWPARARGAIIGISLVILGGACAFAVNVYTRRSRQMGSGSFPLDAWRRQAQAIIATAALPLSAIVVVMTVPPTHPNFDIAFALTGLGSLVLAAASVGLLGSGLINLLRIPRKS